MADLLPRWDAAAKSVGRQLAALADALRATNDPSLRAIADDELKRVTGGLDSALTAALKDYEAGSDHTPGAAAKALDICRALRRRIATEPRVAACDRNRFGAPVAIRATLDPTLADVETALLHR